MQNFIRFLLMESKTELSQEFWKNCDYSNTQKAMLAKIILISSCKISILHVKFCMIPYNRIRDRTITKILGKMKQQRPLLGYMHPNCIIIISIDIYCSCKLLCNFIDQKPQSAYPKNSGKVRQQHHLLSNIHQKLTDFNLC